MSAILWGAPAWAASVAIAEPRILRAGSPHDALFDVAFDGTTGVAVGAFATLLFSTDGGATWKGQKLPPATPVLFGVAMRNGHCIAVGQMGTIVAAPDCQHWKSRAGNTQSRLMAVSLNGAGVAVAVGAFGTVLRSDHSGATWHVIAIDWKSMFPEGEQPHLYGVHVADNGTVTIVGEFGLILQSPDGTGKWAQVHKSGVSLFGQTMLENGHGYAVGQRGTVLATDDGGRSWREVATDPDAILTGVWANPSDVLVVTGIDTIRSSSDGGTTWHALGSNLAVRAWHEAVAVSAPPGIQPRIVVAGAGGMLLDVTQPDTPVQ